MSSGILNNSFFYCCQTEVKLICSCRYRALFKIWKACCLHIHILWYLIHFFFFFFFRIQLKFKYLSCLEFVNHFLFYQCWFISIQQVFHVLWFAWYFFLLASFCVLSNLLLLHNSLLGFCNFSLEIMWVCTCLKNMLQRHRRDMGRQIKKIQWTGLLTCHDHWQCLWIVVKLWLFFPISPTSDSTTFSSSSAHVYQQEKDYRYLLKSIRNSVLLECPGKAQTGTILPVTPVRKKNEGQILHFQIISKPIYYLHSKWTVLWREHLKLEFILLVYDVISETGNVHFKEESNHLDILSGFTRLLDTLKGSTVMNKQESPTP